MDKLHTPLPWKNEGPVMHGGRSAGVRSKRFFVAEFIHTEDAEMVAHVVKNYRRMVRFLNDLSVMAYPDNIEEYKRFKRIAGFLKKEAL